MSLSFLIECILKYIFILIIRERGKDSESERETKRQKDIFHPRIQSPAGCKDVCQELHLSFMWVKVTQAFGHLLLLFPRPLAGNWVGNGASGTGAGTCMGCGNHKWWLYHDMCCSKCDF